MKNPLDLERCKSAIANHSYGDCREKWFEQAIHELYIARQQLDHDTQMIKDRDDAITQKDQRIADLESALGHFGPNEWD